MLKMQENPVAVVLGGTAPHISLVKKLKDRGYRVILVDYLDNPPAAAVADEHIKESTLDKDKVLEIAKENKASLVISTCIDQANSVCCYVAEKLGLPHPYSFQTSLNVTDKGLMKKIMSDNGIPTSPFILVNSVDDIDFGVIEYPAVVKPVDCNSSKGVKRVDSDDEVRLCVEEALKLSRSGMAIIEGFNHGPEIQVDCVSTRSGVKVVLTRQKQKNAAKGSGMVLQSHGSVFPAPLSAGQEEQAQMIAEKIATSFNLVNTPFFYQAIVTEKGIQVIEFAPRIGGGLSYFVLKELAGFDAIESAIDSFEGKDIVFESHSLERRYSTNLLYMKPGTFDHVEGLEELKSNGLVEDIFLFKNKGAYVDSDMKSSNRVAAFFISSESYEGLSKAQSACLESIRIISDRGEDITNRSIY